VTDDPRTPASGRFFRRLFLGIHAALAATFCLLLITGIWNGLEEIRPPRAQPRLTASACAEELSALHQEFQSRLTGFATARSSAEEGRAYASWVVQFRARIAAARRRCSPPLESPQAKVEAIDEAFRALLRSVDLSEVQATHWARHLGPSLDRAAAAIETASE